MIGTVLKELEESVKAQLPDCIERVTNMRAIELSGKTLVSDFTFYDWFAVQTNKVKLSFPAFQFEWKGSSTGQRNGVNARKGKHDIVATYGVRHNDPVYIKNHMLFVPEAILLWLDELPTASRPAGSGLTIAGLDRADDNEIRISQAPELVENGFFTWSVDVPFTVSAADQNLPKRSVITPP